MLKTKPMKTHPTQLVVFLTGIFLFTLLSQVHAQTGTIRGQVLDKQSEAPLLGATIELLDTPTSIGVISDENGRFVLEDVPVGRRSIRISFIGYESQSLPNVEVSSGKDVFITVRLLESLNQLKEVVVTNNAQQDKALNKLAVVSARQFGVEEVSRFSGGRGDVGRLAANFAGVSAPDDSRNDIVVRGNSPTGLLWRLEGIPIPSPNHYSTLGTTGGPVSALNPNLLKNSDFITSAFPAEYGNAIGGVFDLGFRNGNTDRHEFNLQTGIFTGVEALGEGPIGKQNGSFLVAARYSLVGLLGVGAGGTAATPNYSDISFNINFGQKPWGSLSTFGILASSDIEFLGDDIDPDDLFAAEDENTFVDSRFGVVGLKHRLPIGSTSYLKTIVAGSFQNNDFNADRFIDKDTPQERILLYTEGENREQRLTFSTLFNSKLNSRLTLRTGVLLEEFRIESFLADRNEQADNDGDGDPDLFVFRDIDENLSIVQPYLQGQYRLSSAITINAGLHSQYTSINEQWVHEPRAAINVQLNSNNALNFGFGVHHQPVPLPLLFLNEQVGNQLVQTNRELDQVRSDHYVLGYNLKISPLWRAKVEAYYQDITGAAVESFTSSYSSLTEGADFVFENDRVSLVNEGTGFNQGIELTLERFFSKGFYALMTASVFESKYTGSDGIERNTPFNNQYVVNLLAGREFPIGKNRQHIAFIDTRISTSGGRFYTPVNLEASQQAGFEIRQEDEAFSLQYDEYFRWDFKFGVKLNSRNKKQSHKLYFDLQNVTARENVFVQRYNRLTNAVDQVNQIGFFPDFGYAFQF